MIAFLLAAALMSDPAAAPPPKRVVGVCVRWLTPLSPTPDEVAVMKSSGDPAFDAFVVAQLRRSRFARPGYLQRGKWLGINVGAEGATMRGRTPGCMGAEKKIAP